MVFQEGSFEVAECISSPIEDSVIVEVKKTGDVHELNGIANDILDFCRNRFDKGLGFSTDDIVEFLLSSYDTRTIPKDAVQNDVENILTRFMSVGLLKTLDR